MEPTESPNQFRQPTEPTEPTPAVEKTMSAEPMGTFNMVQPNRWATPVIIGLGVLFILGGIVLGIKNKKSAVVILPDYSPIVVSAEVSPSPAVSPSTAITESPATNPAPVVVIKPISPSPAPIVKTAAKTAITPIKSAVTVAKPSSAPAASPETEVEQPSPLPVYQPVVSLPDYQPQFVTSSPSPSPSPITQTMTIHLAVAGTNYTVTVNKNTTVLDVLNAAARDGLTIQTKDYSGLGTYIVSLNGQSETNSVHWMYTINGSVASKGVSAQTVNDGDIITWTLS